MLSSTTRSSGQTFWPLSFRVRDDAESADLRVLAAVADLRASELADITSLPPVVQAYLEEWPLLLADQTPRFSGSPVRLAGRPGGGWQFLIEFSFDDDEFAGRGWTFRLWVTQLIERPVAPDAREVIGWHGLYRNDADRRWLPHKLLLAQDRRAKRQLSALSPETSTFH